VPTISDIQEYITSMRRISTR